ncbi:MAG: redoxin domain-containing protein [Pseudomonadota bacterium]
MTTKLCTGVPFPKTTASKLGGGEVTLGTAPAAQLIVVYRGQHCPVCKSYLSGLEGLLPRFAAEDITVVVASADSEEQARGFMDEIGYTGDVAYGLTIAQMQDLGLHLSAPRTPPETDHVFPEPGLFFVDEEGLLSLVDIGSAPFLRPDLEGVLNGIIFTRSKGFPIRGRYGV